MASRVLTPNDPEYPELLASDEVRPPELFVRGVLPSGLAVAIVGTREPAERDLAFTRELVVALVEHGVAIWSGGAVGVDAAAHRAALEAGGETVVVNGAGLDQLYPREHAALFDEVLTHRGALVAHVPDDHPIRSHLFLERNGVIAGATSATIVIAAGERSGARSTARHARRLNRPLLVVPHSPWDERGRGCALELHDGAIALVTPGDVLAILGLPFEAKPATTIRSRALAPRLAAPRSRSPSAPKRPPPAARRSAPDDLDPIARGLFDVLASSPLHLDDLAALAGVGAGPASAHLVTLALLGLAFEGPAGCFRR